MSFINKLYGAENGKTYYAYNKSCPVCAEWNKPEQLWKTMEFFPFHSIVLDVIMLDIQMNFM